MATPTQSPRPRDRPACARCGGTGTVAGGAVYPGTNAYRPTVPCPACCPVSPRLVRQHDCTTETFPVVRFAATVATHAVWASGGPESGSLYQFTTFCGRDLDNHDIVELPGSRVTCLSCRRSLASRSSNDDRCAVTLAQGGALALPSQYHQER